MSKTSTWAMTAAAVMLSSTLTTFSQQGSAATLYRWTDANGSPVISDRPPPTGTPYTTLNGARYGTSGSISAPQKQPVAESEVAESTPPEAPINSPEPAPAVKTVVEKRPDLCEQAKDNIFKLETFPRIRTTDDDGTVRFMTAEEISSQLETARKVAEANC